MNVEIANKLVSLRKSNGLSQGDLADKIGVSRQAISKWECAESSPDTDNLIALSKLYDITIDELINADTQTISTFSNEKELNENPVKKWRIGSLVIIVLSFVVVGALVYFAAVALDLVG